MDRSKYEQIRYERSGVALEIMADEDFQKILHSASLLYRYKLEESYEDELVRVSSRETKSLSYIVGKLKTLNGIIASGLVSELIPLEDRNIVNPVTGKRKVITQFGGRLQRNVTTNQVLFSVMSTDNEVAEEAKISKSIRGINPARIYQGNDRTPGYEEDLNITVGLKEITRTDDGIVVSDFTGISLGIKGPYVIKVQGVTTKGGLYHYTEDLSTEKYELPQEILEMVYQYGQVPLANE